METLHTSRKAPNSGGSLPIRTARDTERTDSSSIRHELHTYLELQQLDDIPLQDIRSQGQSFNITAPRNHPTFDLGSQVVDIHHTRFHMIDSAAQYRMPSSQYSLTVERFGSPTQAISTMHDSTRRSTASNTCAPLTSAIQSESGSLYTPYPWERIQSGDLNPGIFSFSYGQTDVLSDWQSPNAPWMEISSSVAFDHRDLSDNTFSSHQDLPPTSRAPEVERDNFHTGNTSLTIESATDGRKDSNKLSTANMTCSYSFTEFDWEDTNQAALSGESSPLTQSSADVNSPVSTSEEARHKRKVAEGGGSRKRYKPSKDRAVYICDIEECRQQFSSVKDLHRHKHSTLIHEGECELKFPCNEPRCRRYGNSFARKDNYDRHVKTMHKDFNK